MIATRHRAGQTLINIPIRHFNQRNTFILHRDLSISLKRLSPDSNNKPPKPPTFEPLTNEKGGKDHQSVPRDQGHPSLSPTDEFLERIRPHLDSAHRYYLSSKTQANSILTSLRHHTGKAKEAIKTANEKYEQQEKESANFNFNEDLSTKKDYNDNKNTNKKPTIHGLPSERERNRKNWAKKLEFYIDSLQETIFTATRALNDVTGYSSIQKLRESIDALETGLENSKREVKESKSEYNEAISNRLLTQKEVNELLQRKSSWSPSDLERFTKLYTEDHANALNEENAKIKMEQAEQRQEELYDKLSNAILTRYHEEQIWSDKIRRTSTWGTFGLMGINIFLFLVFQLALEPWKRRRLVGNFEEKVQRALDENSNMQNEKLDLMSEKMEKLKNSDTFPALEESMEPEVIADVDVLFVTVPKVQQLPMVVSSGWNDVLWQYLHKATQPLKAPFALIFYKNYESTIVTKRDMISTMALTVSIGAVIGSLFTSLFK